MEDGADDIDGVFCYALGAHQVDAFRFLFGLKSDRDRYEYFLEPTRPPVADGRAGEPPHRKCQDDRDITVESGRDEALEESTAVFEKLAARSQIKNRRSPSITRSELTVPALRLLEEANGQWVKISSLVERLAVLFEPSEAAAIILSERDAQYFSQKVSNIISHRHSDSSFIHQGLAEYDSTLRRLRITEAGRQMIGSLRI